MSGMTGWVVESDWSKVAAGDRVRLENQDGTVEFDAINVRQTSDCWHIKSGIGDYAEWNWNLSVVPKPTPALPTEPGAVITWKNGAYLGGIAQKCPEGRLGWFADFGNGGRWWTDTELLAVIDETEHTPLVRLESQADTARKVLTRLAEVAYTHHVAGIAVNRTIPAVEWTTVGTEFGVSL